MKQGQSTSFGKSLAASLLLSALLVSTGQAGEFVKQNGVDLSLAGAPYQFVGFNNYRITGDRKANKCDFLLSDETLDKLFKQVQSAGGTVVRTWFFQSYYNPAADNPWKAFDRVLKKAADFNIKVIPVLVNHNPDCEPSDNKTKDERFYESSFRESGWGYPLSYKDWAKKVARHYRANTNIAFFSLVNEPETLSSSGACDPTPDRERWSNDFGRSANILRDFADEMTNALKSVDRNHLVSLGTIGTGQCGAQEEEYKFVHDGNVSLCEYHDYWDETQPIPDDGSNRLRQRIDQCNELGKPFVISESGIYADIDCNGQETGKITKATLRCRAKFFDQKLSAAFSEGIDGYLIWEKIHQNSISDYNEKNYGKFGVGPSDPTNTVTKQYPKPQSVQLLNPSNSSCTGLTVDFQWNIANKRPGTSCSLVLTDKGTDPLDGNYEDQFDAGQSMSLSVPLDPRRYNGVTFQWGVAVTVCNDPYATCPCEGKTLNSEVRVLETRAQPSSCP